MNLVVMLLGVLFIQMFHLVASLRECSTDTIERLFKGGSKICSKLLGLLILGAVVGCRSCAGEGVVNSCVGRDSSVPKINSADDTLVLLLMLDLIA